MENKKSIKLVIFSDSHGRSANLSGAVRLHAADADYFIHLGDGMQEAEIMAKCTDKPFICLPGNCDGMYERLSGGEAPKQMCVDFGGIRVLMCHGHTLDVKYGMGRIEAEARRLGADLALFGHTHTRFMRYINDDDGSAPFWLFNPGSISAPREGAPSYGIADLYVTPSGRKDILLSHAYL